jgi:hypothetical protein
MKDFTRDDAEEGVFLALCRVLILNQMTVEGELTKEIINEAERSNYDALYSTTRWDQSFFDSWTVFYKLCVFTIDSEEYVLLNPKFVLPEFFMHVQLPHVDTSSKYEYSPRPICKILHPMLTRIDADAIVSTLNPEDQKKDQKSPIETAEFDSNHQFVFDILTENFVSGIRKLPSGKLLDSREQIQMKTTSLSSPSPSSASLSPDTAYASSSLSAAQTEPIHRLVEKQAIEMSLKRTPQSFHDQKLILYERFRNGCLSSTFSNTVKD